MIAIEKATHSPRCVIMEEMSTNRNNSPNGLQSQEPHFNDERTLRSAQPVVPLENVTRERRRRHLMLGGAFVIACLLGATAAMALIRLRQPALIDDTTEATTNEGPQEQAVQVNEPESPASEATADTESAAEIATSDVADIQPAKGKKKKSRKHAAAQIMITTTPVSPNQARLIDSWEEKRQRRVRNPQQNHHSSDLFRIREIFEGPRRPRRTNNY